MHCIHCGRPIFREPAATVNTRSGVMHYGPKCAQKAGLLAKPDERRSLIARVAAALRPRRTKGKHQSIGQADWIENLKTQPVQIGQEE